MIGRHLQKWQRGLSSAGVEWKEEKKTVGLQKDLQYLVVNLPGRLIWPSIWLKHYIQVPRVYGQKRIPEQTMLVVQVNKGFGTTVLWKAQAGGTIVIGGIIPGVLDSLAVGLPCKVGDQEILLTHP